MKHTIIEAIQQRAILSFTYRGHNRVVEPHAVGRSTAGNDVLRSYQTSGTSRKNEVPAWKLMTLKNIENLTVTSECFDSPRQGYKRGDKGMEEIYAQL